jgi:hypothetical protein
MFASMTDIVIMPRLATGLAASLFIVASRQRGHEVSGAGQVRHPDLGRS